MDQASTLREFSSMIEHCPTMFHAYDHLNTLQTPLEKYCSGASIAFYQKPKKELKKLLIYASHIDSPALKLKPNPFFVKDGMMFARPDIFGGPLLHSWYDQEVFISGKITIEKQGKVFSKNVSKENLPFLIPSLAKHLNRDEKKELNSHDHLTPLIALLPKGCQQPTTLSELLSDELEGGELLAHDLYFVPLNTPRFVGINQELLSSYRLDNLASAFAMLKTMEDLEEFDETGILYVYWNHEELGSRSQEGANSPFLRELIHSLKGSMSFAQWSEVLLDSLCISIDNVHALHPNYEKEFDKDNSAYLGQGVALKHHANLNYATQLKGASFINYLAKKEHLPIQHSSSKSGQRTGSTVGSIMATSLGIQTLDLGIPQLAMHSTKELMANEDLIHLIKLLTKAKTHFHAFPLRSL